MSFDALNLSEPVTTVLNTLVRSNEETSGQPVLPPESRITLLEWLHHILSDRTALRDYTKFLIDNLSLRYPHDKLLKKEEIQVALHAGLFFLPESVLAHLALNPVALRDLRTKSADDRLLSRKKTRKRSDARSWKNSG